MPLRPSVCFDAVFEGIDVEKALTQVKSCGIGAFEFWCWWEKDLGQIVDLKSKLELDIASCCTKFISLTDQSLRDEYVQGVSESVAAAKKLGCKTLISQVGDFRQGISRKEQHQSIVDGLTAVIPILETADITLVIEPLNEKVDHPGYFLIHSDEAFEIIDAVASDHVKVVFDLYHQQISEGNLLPNIMSNLSKIGHFHAAGNPGRHELTLGEINYPEIFRVIGESNYDGFVGLEYWPKQDPEIGLKEVATWF